MDQGSNRTAQRRRIGYCKVMDSLFGVHVFIHEWKSIGAAVWLGLVGMAMASIVVSAEGRNGVHRDRRDYICSFSPSLWYSASTTRRKQ
jgi:hypothetical protein